MTLDAKTMELLRRIGGARPQVAEYLAGDLAAFVRAFWRTVNPGRRLYWNWHYDLIAEHMTLVSQGKTTRLIVNVPPRSAKTTLISICYPAWRWLSELLHRFLFASYEMTLSKDHNVMRGNLLTSRAFQDLFGTRFRLAEDRNLAEQFSNDREGAMIATSPESRAMGRGGDTIILDDVIDQGAALSDLSRKSVNDWLSQTLFQRQNDPDSSAIVLVMQRLSENDPTGFLLEREPGVWTIQVRAVSGE